MTAMAIDTLGFARKLREGGLDERTADTIAQEVGHFVAANAADKSTLATKADLAEVKADLAAFKAESRANQNWLKWAAGILIALVISNIVLQNI